MSTARNPKTLYRQNRLGKPIQTLNLQWLAPLKNIEHTLKEHHFKPHPTRFDNLQNTLRRFSEKHTEHYLPLLPQLYYNQNPVLLMTRKTNDSKRIIVIRLWPSNTTFKNINTPLWIGTTTYQLPTARWLTLHRKKTATQSAIDALTPLLKKGTWHILTIPKDQQSTKLQALHWNSKLLLIKSNS